MFVKGIDETSEYSRRDINFYKGIVVQNNDPLKMFRVKVFIPELSNQPYDGWLKDLDQFNIRFPGATNDTDAFKSREIFNQITDLIPWAEPCFPLMGEGGSGNYFSATTQDRDTMVSDGSYRKEFLDEYWQSDSWGSLDGPAINESKSKPPTTNDGMFAPAFFYDNEDYSVADAFTNPAGNLTVLNNPYSYEFRPCKHVNKAKGVFGVPNIGTKVWVFHYGGDVNFPVYFGTRHDFRETMLINDLDQPGCSFESLTYPGLFENYRQPTADFTGDVQVNENNIA